MISVIVPVYNAGRFLQPLINSILNQSWQALELILVDDGSTDGSAEICNAASERDPRVRVIHKQNSGQSAARNTGIEAASGDVLAFADHDDLLHPRTYEYLMAAMEMYGTKVAVCDFKNVQQEDFDNISFTETDPDITFLDCEEWLSDLFRPTWRTPIWNKLYKVELFRNIRFGELRLGEDNLLSYQIIKECRSAAFVHETLYFQRMHGDNFEFTGVKYFTDLLRAKQTILHDVRRCFPKIYQKFRKQFLYECVRIFNAYLECGLDKYPSQRMQTLDMIRKNSRLIWFSDMPIGHKFLFTKLRLRRKTKVQNRISV